MNTDQPTWVITGPTSGIGYQTALELATHGTVVLVARNRGKLATVQREIEKTGGHAVSVVADFSDVTSSRDAAAEIADLALSIRGVLNNAGIMLSKPAQNANGWELAFATNVLGPIAFTDALIPSLADGTNVVFITSAVEDPERKIAVRAGFRGSRFTTAEAAVAGKYLPGGSTRPGMDGYATSKQGSLAAVFAMARETPRLHFRAIEPGVNPGSNLGSDTSAAAHAIARVLSPVLALMPHFTTPKRAAKVIARIVTDTSDATGVYYDENGHPMSGSTQVTDPAFSDRFVTESRALIASV